MKSIYQWAEKKLDSLIVFQAKTKENVIYFFNEMKVVKNKKKKKELGRYKDNRI